MLAVVAFFGTKLAAYSLWCLLALRVLAGRRPGDAGRAVIFGCARIVLGIVLGVALVWVMPQLAPAENRAHFSLPVYVGALTIVRVFEWLAIGALASESARVGAPRGRAAAWVAGGVGLSYFTDALVIAAGIGIYGVPC